MDWSFAVERNREALKRVLAGLVAMAELAALGSPVCPEGASGRGGAGRDAGRPTLPRHLHRAVLRLLRPAESAARRLVVMAARRVAATLPRPRPRKPKPASVFVRPGVGTGIVLPLHLRRPAKRAPKTAGPLRLSLFDPLRRERAPGQAGPGGRPRIAVPGIGRRQPVRRPLQRTGSPDDAIDAGRLHRRLAALAKTLDDLPREAKRFARWRAARDAEGAQTGNRDAAGAQTKGRDAEGAQTKSCDREAGRNGSGAPVRAASAPAADAAVEDGGRKRRRVWPLKPGRPPGLDQRSGHLVHEVLRDVHSLALRALERRDSS